MSKVIGIHFWPHGSKAFVPRIILKMVWSQTNTYSRSMIDFRPEKLHICHLIRVFKLAQPWRRITLREQDCSTNHFWLSLRLKETLKERKTQRPWNKSVFGLCLWSLQRKPLLAVFGLSKSKVKDQWLTLRPVFGLSKSKVKDQSRSLVFVFGLCKERPNARWSMNPRLTLNLIPGPLGPRVPGPQPKRGERLNPKPSSLVRWGPPRPRAPT